MSLKLNSSGGGSVTLQEPTTASDVTLSLPAANTTIVGTDATQTLTNKTIQGGAVTSGTAVASTSGTAIDFTGIPSWAKRITVMFSGVSTSGSSNYQVQIGSGSVTTSGYACGFSFVSSGAATANATSGFVVANPSSAAVVFSGILTIALVSSNTWVSSHVMGETDAARAMLGGGTSPSLGGTLDRVRITTVNGTDTFDAGTINILYEG